MRSIKKINLISYILLTSLTTGVCCWFALGVDEVIGILIVYAATIINHLLLIEGGLQLTDAASGNKIDKLNLVFIFLGKFALLIGAIYLGWQFMGNRVFIPMLNYLVQIFILIFSYKREV
jgi:hypothetical protein